MAIISELREHVEALASHAEFDVDADELAARMDAADDVTVLELLAETTAVSNDVERMRTIAAGVLARRSSRERGHGGLAATQGHRTPSDLIQSVTGVTRAEAERQLRQGRALLDAADDSPATEPGADASDGGSEQSPADETPGAPNAPESAQVAPPARWDAVLTRALLDGGLSPARHDAILRGLGEPPATCGERADVDTVREVWSLAARQLREEAHAFTAQELLRRARQVRDSLDPVGAEEQFQHRFAQRSFHMWVDEHGQHHARMTLDDEMAAWVRAMVDAALRARRGGPRFVGEDDKRAAKALADDPRTNDQLAYDLLVSTLRAGALADAKDVFGARQPGVRMIVVKDAPDDSGPTNPRDAFGRMLATAHFEDGGEAVAGSVLDRTLCNTGHREIVVDSCGNPLNLGREQRLFGAAQKIAFATRDGGCLWPDCRMPASYCEAHHIDRWTDGGRTDIDRGLLFCRFHHMHVHDAGWRVTRDDKGPFVLHPPPGMGEPIVLISKSPLRWAWDPPPPPTRAGWREAPAPPPRAFPDRMLAPPAAATPAAATPDLATRSSEPPPPALSRSLAPGREHRWRPAVNFPGATASAAPRARSSAVRRLRRTLGV